MSAPLFLFFARTQHENMGDRGIAVSLLSAVSQFGTVCVNGMGCPEDYLRELREFGFEVVVENKAIFLAKRAFSSLLQGRRCVLLMKPGHFFGSDGGLISRMVQAITIGIVFLLGVKVYRFGCSLGPFTSMVGCIERFMARIYTKYTVRENISADYVRSIGVARVSYFPDLAFSLPTTFMGSGALVAPDDRSAYVISFRRSQRYSVGVNLVNCLKLALSGVTQLSSAKRVYGVAQVTRDELYIRELLQEAGLVESASQLCFPNNSREEIFDLYKKTRMIISNRLHSLLFAAKCGALPVALVDFNENAKIVGVFRAVGLDDLLIDLSDSDAGIKILAIESRFDSLLVLVAEAFVRSDSIIIQELEGCFGENEL